MKGSVLINKDEQIKYARFLIERISQDFLQEGSPYIIQEGFEHLRDLLVLYGKQTNLLESVLVLIENNMAEEAFILFRSMINNYMLLEYLTHDNENRVRYNEFLIQPVKSKLKFLYDFRDGIEKGWISKVEFPDLEKNIIELEKELEVYGEKPKINRGKRIYKTTPITISKMAWSDELLFNYYITHYKEASAFEHSDPSSLNIYKDQLLEEYNTNGVFTLNLSSTDLNLEETVLKSSIGVFTMSYLTLLKYYSNNYEYLIEERKTKLIEIGLIMNSTNL